MNVYYMTLSYTICCDNEYIAENYAINWNIFYCWFLFRVLLKAVSMKDLDFRLTQLTIKTSEIIGTFKHSGNYILIADSLPLFGILTIFIRTFYHIA